MPSARVTSLALRGMEQHFGRDGIDVLQVAQHYGLPDDLWVSHEQTISLKQFVRLLEGLGDLALLPDRTWQAGLHYNIAELGETGKLICSCKTLGDALLALRDFFNLLQSDAYLSVQINEQHTTVGYKILNTEIWPRRRDAEFTLGLVQGIVQRFVAPQSYPCSVILEDYSDASRLLSQTLHFPCHAGGDTNQFRFPTALLNTKQPISLAPAEHPTQSLRQRLQQQLAQKHRTTPLTDRVRCCILRHLGNSDIDQAHIAQALGMSERTLRRKLAEEGHAFQEILDACRMQSAALNLEHSQLTQTEIALKTGFSEQSSFIRAFNKWFGETPTQYQRRIRSTMPSIHTTPND